MKNLRVGILSGLAVTAALALGAAPASAQTPTPPCTVGPNSTVPDAIACGFDTAVWAYESVSDPVALIRAVQAEWEKALAAAQAKATETLQLIDDTQKLVVNEVCTRFEIDPENCPDI